MDNGISGILVCDMFFPLVFAGLIEFFIHFGYTFAIMRYGGSVAGFVYRGVFCFGEFLLRLFQSVIDNAHWQTTSWIHLWTICPSILLVSDVNPASRARSQRIL